MTVRTDRMRAARERGSSSLEMVLLLPFVVTTFMILVGLGYALATKQHALVAARYASTYDVAKGATPTPEQVGHAASVGTEAWNTTVERDEPPAFIPFLSSFDSSGTATGNSTWRVLTVDLELPHCGRGHRQQPYTLPGGLR